MISDAVSTAASTFHALCIGVVRVVTYENTTWSFYPWLMIILCGIASDIGCTLGTLLNIPTRKLVVLPKCEIARLVP
ncbi:MAG: hypothetical protein DRJ40_08565 [Thermoprotei archaeon]|nr:MAG: hypothetical protein DRJ40_08565 [Thermoprotei archaeon]